MVFSAPGMGGSFGNFGWRKNAQQAFMLSDLPDLTAAMAYYQGKGRLRAAKEAGEAAEAAAKRRAKVAARVPPTAAEAADMAKAYAEASFKARLPWVPFVGSAYEGYTAHEQQSQMEQQMEEMYKSASAADRQKIDAWLSEIERKKKEAAAEFKKQERQETQPPPVWSPTFEYGEPPKR